MGIKAVMFDLDGTLLPMDQGVFIQAYFGGLCKRLAPHGYDPEQLVAAIWAGTGAMVKNTGENTNEAVFRKAFEDIFGDRVKGDYAEFDRMASEIPIGCDGLVFHPYLMGELTPFADPALRGSFIGIGASHTKAHFARAVMEGVAMSLLDCRKYLIEKGVSVKDVAYVIGGGAKSEVWRQIVADALGITLIMSENNDSSFGSAMCAGVGAGFFGNIDQAIAVCQKTVGKTAPVAQNTEKYKKLFEKYKKISQFLTELVNEK